MNNAHANSDLILASASPRRKELLTQIGVNFSALSVDLDETPLKNENPCAYVQRLAIAKAQAGSNIIKQNKPVLGSDTTVVCDGIILGKPIDKADSIRILTMLSGSEHQVITAIAIVQGDTIKHEVVSTDVRFRDIDIQEIENYWNTGEPVDKAGSYGIQGLGSVFVEYISGSYSAVVGLPLAQTATLLSAFNIPIWNAQ
jgi:septum formation protein